MAVDRARILTDFLEHRRLLSGYAVSNVSSFGPPSNAQPLAALVLASDQNLYGTTSTGGSSNDGTVFEINSVTHALTTIANFNASTGNTPWAGLVQGTDQNFYGTTQLGGTSNDGTVFEVDNTTHALSTIVNFNASTGQNPVAALVVGSDHNFYGVTNFGGPGNYGTVFEVDSSTHAFSTQFSFNLSTGNQPRAAMILGPDQNLYGTSLGGGGDGSVFEINSNTHILSTIVQFSGTNGADPWSLIVGPDNNFYGTTNYGGTSGDGTVFSINSSTHALNTIINFNSSTGIYPDAGLVLGADNNFYGTTYEGGTNNHGTLFEVNSATHAFTTLLKFNTSSGISPYAGLTLGADQNFYGANQYGGASNLGTVFEMNASSHALKVIANFNSSSGLSPGTGLVLAPDHNFYGLTSYGGPSNLGTVYEVDSNTHAFTTLASFNSSNGAVPQGQLVVGADHNLYGTTNSGGSANDGTVFEINISNHALTTVINFNASTCTYPAAGLVLGPDQNLYGTSTSSPTGTYTAFELNGITHALTTIASLTNADVIAPEAALIVGPDNNLYGTSAGGGTPGDGTVFEININTHLVTIIAAFNSSTGANPYDSLVLGSDQNFYGTTENGGTSSEGTIFEIDHSTHALTTIANFNAASGSGGLTQLVLGPDQNLYGTTQNSGANNDGTIFQIARNSDAFITVASLDSADGQAPLANLIQGADLNLYGTSVAGGAFGYGAVFELALPPLVVTSDVTTLPAGTGPGITINAYSNITVAAGAELATTSAGSQSSRILIATGSLNLATTGLLDLSDNDLDVANGSLTKLTNELAQGFNTATGGIVSKFASFNDPSHLTTLGVIQNSVDGSPTGSPLYGSGTPLGLFDGENPANSDVLVKYTYYGDANLDGKVDASDYSRIDSGFLTAATGWYNGDFNYDGVINGSDYTLIDNAFNRQGASLAAELRHVSDASALVSAAARPISGFAADDSILTANSGSPVFRIASFIFADGDDDLSKKKLELADSSLLR